uniref:hypothetical protein n=1 Tax=Salmonella sp. s54925 TaxID=3159674 RepID=UPI0039814D92
KTSADKAVSISSSGFFSHVYKNKPAYGEKNKTPKLDDQLNNATPSYEGVMLKFKSGEYHYMCTRNNNFSNRNQKAKITVKSSGIEF